MNQQNNISNNNLQQFDLTFHSTTQNNLTTPTYCMSLQKLHRQQHGTNAWELQRDEEGVTVCGHAVYLRNNIHQEADAKPQHEKEGS